MVSLPRPIPDPLIELIAEELRVLGQPSRLRLIDYLERYGETTVQALADDLDATQQNVSRHLGILLEAGVVARRQEGRAAWYKLRNRDAFGLVEDIGLRTLQRLQDRAEPP